MSEERERLAKEVAADYMESLGDLQCNSKPLISMLTMIADENKCFALEIVKAIEKHISSVRPEMKLPVLYLIDSIMKNVSSQYAPLFTQIIVNIFCQVFDKVDEQTREAMFKLRQTWKDIFPVHKLMAIDHRVKSIDPAWPITAKPVSSLPNIHVNPRFVSTKSPSQSSTIAVAAAPKKETEATAASKKEEMIPVTEYEKIEKAKKELEMQLLSIKQAQESPKNNSSERPEAKQKPSKEAAPEKPDLSRHHRTKTTAIPRLKHHHNNSKIKEDLDKTKHPSSPATRDPRISRKETPSSPVVEPVTKKEPINKDPRLSTSRSSPPLSKHLPKRLDSHLISSAIPRSKEMKKKHKESKRLKRLSRELEESRQLVQKLTPIELALQERIRKEQVRSKSQDSVRSHKEKAKDEDSPNVKKRRYEDYIKEQNTKNSEKTDFQSRLDSRDLQESDYKKPQKVGSPKLRKSFSPKHTESPKLSESPNLSRHSPKLLPSPKLPHSPKTLLSPKRSHSPKVSQSPISARSTKSPEMKQRKEKVENENKNRYIPEVQKLSVSSKPRKEKTVSKYKPRKVTNKMLNDFDSALTSEKSHKSKKDRHKTKHSKHEEKDKKRSDIKLVAGKTEENAGDKRQENPAEVGSSQSRVSVQDNTIQVKENSALEVKKEDVKIENDIEMKDGDCTKIKELCSDVYMDEPAPLPEKAEEEGSQRIPKLSSEEAIGDVDLRTESPEKRPIDKAGTKENEPPTKKLKEEKEEREPQLFGIQDRDDRTLPGKQPVGWDKYKQDNPDTFKTPLKPSWQNIEGSDNESKDVDLRETSRSRMPMISSDGVQLDRLGRPIRYERLPEDPDERRSSLIRRLSDDRRKKEEGAKQLQEGTKQVLSQVLEGLREQVKMGRMTEEQYKSIALVTEEQYKSISHVAEEQDVVRKMEEDSKPEETEIPSESQPSSQKSRSPSPLKEPEKPAPSVSPKPEEPSQDSQPPLEGGQDIDMRFPMNFSANKAFIPLQAPPVPSFLFCDPLQPIAPTPMVAPPAVPVTTPLVAPPPLPTGLTSMSQPLQPPPRLPIGADVNTAPGISLPPLPIVQMPGGIPAPMTAPTPVTTAAAPVVPFNDIMQQDFSKPPPSIDIPKTMSSAAEGLQALPTEFNIPIDNVERYIRSYGEDIFVFMSWDDPREIKFRPGSGSGRVIIDGTLNVPLNVGATSDYTEVPIDGVIHRIKIGGPTQELYMDGKGYECSFEGPPIQLMLDGRPHTFKLDGEPPTVIIGDVKRTDFVCARIEVTINGTIIAPVYLDATEQYVPLDSPRRSECPPYATLKFMDSLERVLLNNQPYECNFGGPPQCFDANGDKHYIKFPSLPSHVVPGEVTLMNMMTTKPPTTQTEPNEGYEPVLPMPVPRQSRHNRGGNDGAPSQPLDVLLDICMPKKDVANPTEPAPVSDINLLLSQLKQVGLLPSAKKPVEKEEPDITKLDLTFLSESLRKRRSVLISSLYCGRQCSDCGVRFPTERSHKYKYHLDWHFRQNKQDNKGSKGSQSRHWYYEVDGWVQFEEVEENEPAQSWFVQKAQEQEEEEKASEIPTVTANEKAEENKCGVCFEDIDTYYDKDAEEWKLRGAVRGEDGKVYHPQCQGDATLNATLELDNSATASRSNSLVEEEEKAGKGEPETVQTIEEVDVEESTEKPSKLETKRPEDKKEDEGMDYDDEEVSEIPIIKEPKPVETVYDDDDEEEMMRQKEEEEKQVDDGEVTFLKTDKKGTLLDEILLTETEIKKEPEEPMEETTEVPEEELEEELPEIEDEPEIEKEVEDTSSQDAMLVVSSIEGNMEIENRLNMSLPSAPIKINITNKNKDSPADSPAPEEENEVEIESIEEPSVASTHILNLSNEAQKVKPRLVARKLTVMPKTYKGTDMSGLCSIM